MLLRDILIILGCSILIFFGSIFVQIYWEILKQIFPILRKLESKPQIRDPWTGGYIEL